MLMFSESTPASRATDRLRLLIDATWPNKTATDIAEVEALVAQGADVNAYVGLGMRGSRNLPHTHTNTQSVPLGTFLYPTVSLQLSCSVPKRARKGLVQLRARSEGDVSAEHCLQCDAGELAGVTRARLRQACESMHNILSH